MVYKLSFFFFTTCVIALIERYIPFIFRKISTVNILHHLITTISAHYFLFKYPGILFHVYDYKQEDISPYFLYVPIITCSFAFYELYGNAFLKKNIDYLIHGIMMVFVSILFLNYENFHWTYPALLMETSSIFLNLMQLDNKIYKYLFGVTFVFYRNLLFPYISFVFYNENFLKIISYYPYYPHEKGTGCLLLVTNTLNFYWGYKIIEKFLKTIKNE